MSRSTRNRLLIALTLIAAIALGVIVLALVLRPEPRPRGPALVYQYYGLGDSAIPSQIYRIDIADGALVRLSSGDMQDERPAVSPDGRYLAFQRRPDNTVSGELHIMEIATGHTRLVSDADGSFSNITWSPDGERLAFTRIYGGGIVSIHTIDRDGTDLRPLLPQDVHSSFPVWSPDGTQIAYTARTGEWPGITSYMQVYVLTLADGEPRQIMDLSSTAPVWSPDGRWIAVSAQTFYAEPGQLYLIDAATGDHRHIATPGSISEPVWSPDGTQIAFVSRSSITSDDPDIYVIDANGSDLRRLTFDLPLRPGALVWSPDGAYLAFSSYDGTSGDVHLLDLANGVLRNLTSSPPGTIASSPVWIP
jgi:Tol biopolymer transport system component